MMNDEKIIDLQKKIFSASELSEVYDVVSDCNKLITQIRIDINTEEDLDREVHLQGDVANLKALVTICYKKMNELGDVSSKLNHSFKGLAKRYLESQHYYDFINAARAGSFKDGCAYLENLGYSSEAK